jgi:hypothetical protein
MSYASDDSHNVSVLNQQVTLPQFAFFQVMKVKSTGEIATIMGMKYNFSSQPSENCDGEWLYLLVGLTQSTATWWKFDQLRSLDRR